MTEKEVWDKAYKSIFELYGDMRDMRIISRFYSEKQAFFETEKPECSRNYSNYAIG